MPLGLAQKGPRRYLVCRSEGDDNERSLAIHRIQQAEASGLNFESTAQFSLACYDAEGQFGSGEGRKIQLSFCITREAGQHLLETPHCADQVVEKIAYGLQVVHATVIDSGQLTWWLNGFGQDVWNIRNIRKCPAASTNT